VRDAATTLPATLRSIARQRGTSFECVVVDDGSRDDSVALVRAFAEQDARFRPLVRPRRGLVAALNAGLEICRGRYVARMDADDVMHRCRLVRQRAALERDPALAAVGCHVRIFPRRALGPGMRAYEAWLCSLRGEADVRRDAFVECPIAHPTLFARCDAMRALGYREAGWPEDYDWVLRALSRGLRLGVVPERLLAWRADATRLSRSSPTYAIDRFVACKAHFLVEGFLAEAPAYVLWGHGGTGRALRSALAAHGRTPSHIVELHPGRIGQHIHGAPVVPPDALPRLPRHPLLVSVAGEGPRAQIRAALARMGFEEGRDFLCAA
jgi:glycosyltransferase involved in cell wall biosynthesis